MKKKLLSLLLAVVMICSTLVTMSVTAFAADPELIENVDDFKAFMEAAQTDTYASKTVKLMADIDASGITWKAIPTFAGILDGNGKTISNLTVSNANGMFITLNGTVQNITFHACHRNGSATWQGVGLVAQHLYGSLKFVTLKDCTVTVTAGSEHVGALVGQTQAGSAIENCQVVDGTITAEGSERTGGFVGTANADTKISNCSNSASVTGENAGGIVGAIGWGGTPTLGNCVNFGAISASTKSVGGIVGKTLNGGSLTITNCMNAGAVTSTSEHAGGIVGYLQNDALVLTDCLNTGTVKGASGSRTGGIVGYVSYAQPVTLTNCINAGKIDSTHQTNAGNLFGFAKNASLSCTIQSCYYLDGLSTVVKDTKNIGINTWSSVGTDDGDFRVIYPAAGVDFTFQGGVHNKDENNGNTLETQQYNRNLLNAMFTGADNANIPAGTKYKTGAVKTEAELSGVDGASFLTKAGFAFGTEWYITDGMPVPTALALENQALDTEANIVYKGYQSKLVDGTETTASIRLIAGLQSREFATVGYELSAVDVKGDGSTLMLPEQNTNVVYTSLQAYTETGELSTPVTAESCKCAFLSAITVNDLPTEGTLSLVLKPFVADAFGNRTYGSSVVLFIKDGEVAAQYTF